MESSFFTAACSSRATVVVSTETFPTCLFVLVKVADLDSVRLICVTETRLYWIECKERKHGFHFLQGFTLNVESHLIFCLH